MIPINKPFLPPSEVYEAKLKDIWRSGVVTNNGPMVLELEKRLKDFLGCRHLFLVSSGMAGLQLAVRELEKKGEVLTSAFSYVAASSAIEWAGCKPVFSDCDPKTLCMDPSIVREKITADTIAILPTHLYGHSCDIDAFETLSEETGIPVIYDAAHSFGSLWRGKPVSRFGTISILSFHAYKIFHTIEGGAVITDDDELAEKIYALRYFGIDKQGDFISAGSNAKMSEMHAAMGLCNLDFFPEILKERKLTFERYSEGLKNSAIRFPDSYSGSQSNFGYIAVLFPEESILIQAMNLLNENGIQSKRYFYPAVHQTPAFGGGKLRFSNAESVSRRILCLPCFYGLKEEEIQCITSLILKSLG